ncbi:MAG: dUTP diphosphatase [Thermodesulfobacteriota bacterium]
MKDSSPHPLIHWKKLHPEAILPRYQTAGASGFDLHSVEDGVLSPGTFCLFDTGWSVAIPTGFEMQVRPRSGLAITHGVTVLNGPGTIDSDYRGPLKVILVNHGREPFIVQAGDRIAQGVIMRVEQLNFQESPSLSDTERNSGGFGSTGHQ